MGQNPAAASEVAGIKKAASAPSAGVSTSFPGTPIPGPTPAMGDRQDFDRPRFLTVNQKIGEPYQGIAPTALVEQRPALWGF